MNRGLLDTDMLSDYLKGVPQVVEKARQYVALFGAQELSVVSYYEAHRGLEWASAHRKLDVRHFNRIENLEIEDWFQEVEGSL